MSLLITSAQNPRLKEFASLRDAAARRESGRFLIEGHREVGRALAAGVVIETVLACPEVFRSRSYEAEAVLRAAEQAGVERIDFSAAAFGKLSAREHPDGILAVAFMRPLALADLGLGTPPLVLIVEGVEKPGNLGALLRTAEAAGVDAVIATDPATDFHNPNVIRAAQGASFSVPTAVASGPEVAGWLVEHALTVAATTPDTSSLLWDFDFSQPCAILLGSEAHGLSSFWLKKRALDQAGPSFPQLVPLRLPMAGASDSLNVSATAAIALFEAVRQRAAGGLRPA